MPLCVPDDRGDTCTVKKLDLEHPSVSAVEGIFTVLIRGVLHIHCIAELLYHLSLMLS